MASGISEREITARPSCDCRVRIPHFSLHMSVAVRLASGNVLVRMDTLGQAKSIPPARHSHHFVQIAAAIAALAGLLFGFDTGVISGAILFHKGSVQIGAVYGRASGDTV